MRKRVGMKGERRWGFRRIAPIFMAFLLPLSLPSSAGATETVPWEDYRPKLEFEYLIPFLYYDGKLYTMVYGQMSSVLRDQELKFLIHSDQREEKFDYSLGYTRHLNKWSLGVNLYSMPVYIGQFWESGFLEYQRGVSLLASYHWENETRIDFRLQWEDFSPYNLSDDRIESGKIFGWEVTANRDTHQFLAQSGSREYISLGGAYPVFNTDYRYLKIEGDHRSYYPLGESFSFIWSARGGILWDNYPVQRGFMIGGIQFTNFSALGSLVNLGFLGNVADTVLRGYHLHQFPGDRFVVNNIELRGLIWPSSYYQIGDAAVMALAFVDSAQIWKDGSAVTQVPAVACGAGLKFLLFRGLMLGVDYAVPLTGSPRDLPKWHISLGEVF